MAERRMFSKRIISSDAFLDMPNITQLFYFHLSMMADDDGFVDCTRSVMRSVGAKQEDIDMLIENEFIIYFPEKSVSVIRHWNVSNSIRSDRYKETKYKELKNRLYLDENDVYVLQEGSETGTEPHPFDNQMDTNGCQTVPPREGRIDQVNLSKYQEREREDSLSGDFSKDDVFNPGEKDLVARVDDLRKAWESCGLPPSAIITNLNVLDSLKDTLFSFPDEKIGQAIKNFSMVVSQTDFDPGILPGGHIPNFKNFLIRWVDRFVDEAKPLERFKTKTKGKTRARDGPDWGGEVDMGKGVKAKQFFGGNKR
jgi:hypothetical protein